MAEIPNDLPAIVNSIIRSWQRQGFPEPRLKKLLSFDNYTDSFSYDYKGLFSMIISLDDLFNGCLDAQQNKIGENGNPAYHAGQKFYQKLVKKDKGKRFLQGIQDFQEEKMEGRSHDYDQGYQLARRYKTIFYTLKWMKEHDERFRKIYGIKEPDWVSKNLCRMTDQ